MSERDRGAILLMPDQPPKPVPLPESYEELRAVCTHQGDGYVEAVGLGFADATSYGDEEAKLLGRDVRCEVCSGLGKAYDEYDDFVTCEDCYGSGVIEVEGLPENKLATMLVYGDKESARARAKAELAHLEALGVGVVDLTTDDPREPFIAGPLLVTGFDPNTGENEPVPAEVVAMINKLYEECRKEQE